MISASKKKILKQLTITAAVVSPPIMDANINDGRMSHFSMKIPKAAISAMLDKT